MANKKFYAVRVGRNPGVYGSWDECKSQVYQFPGAVFKGFESEDDARKFVNCADDNNGADYDGVVAYVDGSFDEATNTYSYGVVVLNGEQETHLSGVGNDVGMAKMRNVAGEIMGAMTAMQYAKDNGIKEILIAHDYSGISGWCTGWKTNEAGTAAYKSFYVKVAKDVKVRFEKVKGHSGNYYNDVADALAKREVGIKIKKSLEEHILNIKNMV